MNSQISSRRAATKAAAPHPLIVLVIALAVCFAAAAIGSAATIPNIAGWYQGLAKPGFTPPNGVFGPVWTVLYLLMAIAIWRVFTRSEGRTRRNATIVFAVQLALNILWSLVFFGLHAIVGGLAVIILLEIAILATIRAFARIDRPAAFMLAPYAVWVGYATLLNLAILILN